MKRGLLAVVVFLVAFLPAWAGGRQESPHVDFYSIGVFVPGVVEGSPTYELLVQGVTRAVEESEAAQVSVVEGGFNQAEWGQAITAMAASGSYDLIVSSNPEIPDIVASVQESFPDQRFLLMDAFVERAGVRAVMFNQREQAFLSGYFAGLVTESSMVDGAERVRAGILAGQEYPVMNTLIVPGFELGLRAVNPDAEVDFRVLGNWYDAAAAAELASSMYATGSHVILVIAGGGNQGVVASARERDRYVLWYDTNGMDEAPGIVIGSTFVALDRAVYERTLQAIDGSLEFGSAEILGVADGYVGFVEDDALYRRHVSEEVREQQRLLMERMETGEFWLEMELP